MLVFNSPPSPRLLCWVIRVPIMIFFKLELVELNRNNRKMVVKCWVDSVGWGVDSMGGLIGEWLGEVSKVSDWSINIVGNFVSGKSSKRLNLVFLSMLVV